MVPRELLSRYFARRECRSIHPILVALLAPWIAQAAAPAAQAAPRPNIVFILADDLGFETLGAYGGMSYESRSKWGPAHTPNLDQLAQTGMRFENCFCEPVCSPSRAELMTGKYNFRSGFVSIVGRYGAPGSLDQKAHSTLAANLKAAGYATAIAGKWHLGKWPLDPSVDKATQGIPATPDVDTDCPHVKACGFDRQFVFAGSRLEGYGQPTPEGYVPARFSKWMERFLESRKGQSEPFFLYYGSPIPHVPLVPTPLNPGGKPNGNENFPAAVQYLDQQVGQIVKQLEWLGLRENTLLMFSGDNGACQVNTQMRGGRLCVGGKASMLDTGSHVPLIANWPAKIPAGTVYTPLVAFPDIMPTCLELAGAKPPAGLDGISFAPQLQGQASFGEPRQWVHVLLAQATDKKDRETVEIHYFVRDMKWKLRENGELYDVSDTPYQEKLVPAESDTPESKAARERLQAVLNKLHG